MKLSPGRYLLTATIDHNLLGLGLPAGTRVTAAVVFRASGVHSYRLTKIAPNPSAYALEQGAFEYDGWEDGHAAMVKELLGHKVDIVVTAHPGGALEVSAVHADTGIPMFDASGAWRRAKDQSNLGESVAPPVVKPAKGFRFATDFLTGWPGGRCDLFQLSPATTAAERDANLEHKRVHGYTVVCPYFHNTGDGGGKHPVNALKDVAHTHAVLEQMRAAGLAVVGFIFSDSHKVSKADQPRIALETVKAFDAKVAAWCLYLEPKDTSDSATLEKVAAAVRGATDKLIFIHTYPAASDPGSIRQYTSRPWCDGVLVQVSHPAKPILMANVPRVARGLLAAANGKYVIAMEYSWTAIERDMGDAWADNGLHGVGDGCNAVTVAKLPLLVSKLSATGGGSDSPVAPVGPSPTTPGAALTFRYIGGGQRDVSWSPAVDRRGWPTKSVDGATCDGLLYGCRAGGEPRKIEWIKRGDSAAHTKNAWAFAKDRKYNQGWAGGERVRLEIRDVAGNLRDFRHGGEVVLA